MGLESKRRVSPDASLWFAPCVGLERATADVDVGAELFAPCVGLERNRF